MTRKGKGIGLFVAAGLVAVSAGLAGGPTPPVLAKLQSLAGDWVAAEDGDMVKKGDLVARYRLTGHGSAVVEDVFPDTPHAMTTVYHADGSDVVLTHYCMSGNQPRMRAKGAAGSRVDFAFDGGTNIDPKRDRHMHQASFEFVGDGEIRSAWTEYDGGKPSMTVKFHLVRKTS